jgi:hypothetical protein
MGLLDKLFNKKTPDSSKSTEQITTNDSEMNFDKLVEKARTSGNNADLEVLYKSFFKLEEWVFIVSKNCEIENAKPFIGVLEDQPWLYVFTDSSKADHYAKLFGNFHSKDGNTIVLKMKRTNSLNMAKELSQRGVIGIRINEGENGWFCSIQELFGIINHYQINLE